MRTYDTCQPATRRRQAARQGHHEMGIHLARALSDPRRATPRDLLGLQRLAGNRAVSALLVQRASGQAETEEADVIGERVGGGVDTLNQAVIGQVLSGTSLPTYSSDPTGGTMASNYGGVTGPSLSVLTSGFGLGFSSKRHHGARKELKTATMGSAKHRVLTRDVKSSGADIGENTTGVVSNVFSTVGGGLQNFSSVAQNVSYGVGSVGGGLAVPLSAFQTGRYIRKAEKARKRVQELKKLMADEGQPDKALAAAKEEVKVLEATLVEAQAGVDGAKQGIKELKGQIGQTKTVISTLKGRQTSGQETEGTLRSIGTEVRLQERRLADQQNELSKLESNLADLRSTRDDTTADLQAAGEREKEHQKAADAMRDALDDASQQVKRDFSGSKTEQVSLRMIQAYALKKNNRGWVKKAIAATGGALGTAGGVAGLVTSIALAAGVAAGSAILVATPIGWALAGAAALVGLGLASYKAWQFFSRRWKQTELDAQGNKQSTGKRLAQTLAFWKKVGPSKREQYADALYEMAKDRSNKVKYQEARKLLGALGLDWTQLGMRKDPVSAKALIAAKLAS